MLGLGACPAAGQGMLPRREEHSVHDQFDVTLEDQELLDEVDLTTSLIIAASESDTALSQAQIDEILGVVPVVEKAEDPETPGAADAD